MAGAKNQVYYCHDIKDEVEYMAKVIQEEKKEQRLWRGMSLKPGSPLCSWLSRGLAVLFPIAVLLAVTWLLAGLTPYYAYQFEKNGISDVTGIAKADLATVIEAMADYVVGRSDSMQVSVPINGVTEPIYGERELKHMVDVRQIFDALRYTAAGYFFILLVFLAIDRKRILGRLNQLARYGLWGTLIIALALGVLVATDFTRYFYAFHELFFTNDLWLLDPETDVLIQMLPEVFFRDMALAILVLSFAFQWLFKLLSGQLLRLETIKNNGIDKEAPLC